MKTSIHPDAHVTKVTCACGNSFDTLSTIEEISVEVCSSCHPFFTGKQKIVDTAGRVDKFKAAREAAEKAKAEAAERAKKKSAKEDTTETEA
ncbi:MAG: 50S ribosomal protein L31 [Candidatus Doudnabacteria bacterium]|nr:50S ribosomal protein L31 [Candidatus Doudnabacteria bacterium]MCA9387487.1 50S ribosomal protein L31 [Candidatus Andersenbacteria bacterium]